MVASPRRPRWLAGVLGAAALLSSHLVLAAADPAVASAAQSPIGAHSMLQLNDPYSFMRVMFAEAANMHASVIRLDVAPALVFTSPSQPPDFSGLDEVMALSQQYHLRVLGDLVTIPPWIADCPGVSDPAYMARCATDDLAAYRGFISQIVAHADPVIRDWEIWNEPDNGQFFTGTPQQYAQMLRSAHDAIKTIDPEAQVLLGGISSTSGMSWLAQVFAAPGADAAHAFDIANIHERGQLDALAADVQSWKQFLAQYGFTGPLWVTEHGYPSAAGFQYDPSYSAGPPSQAAYLTASIPTLLDAGASEVFVTERDNLSGPFASEGVLGGDVLDPPVADPQVIEKPSYGAVRSLADCYVLLAHDCPGPAPAAAPASVAFPATRLRSTSTTAVSVSDPAPGPAQLGAVTLAGPGADPIAIEQQGCTDHLLEPDQRCTILLRFKPTRGGSVHAQLEVPSSDGMLGIPVSAVAPSVSSLTWRRRVSREFVPLGSPGGAGHTRQLVLRLHNPLTAAVHVRSIRLSGRGAHFFRIESNSCAPIELKPHGGCRLSVLFASAKPGTARAMLILRGEGTPLRIRLRANPLDPLVAADHAARYSPWGWRSV